jgi:hypothetical protein
MCSFWQQKKVERRVARVTKRQRNATIQADYDKGEVSTLDPNAN